MPRHQERQILLRPRLHKALICSMKPAFHREPTWQREASDMSLFDHPFDPAREAALVTGAGNGIGRAIAQALVGEGVRTVFADINEDTVAASVKASPRPELAVAWIGDLAKRAACDALLADAQSAVGQ